MTQLLASLKARRRFWTAFAIGVVSLAIMAGTIDGPGPTWDEPYSIYASETYVDWLFTPSAWFSGQQIYDHWAPNHEHPPLAKLTMGLVRKTMNGIAGTGRAIPASRMSTAWFFAALMVGVYLFAADSFGEAADVLSCACLMLMPRVFGHAHLAVLDIPMACMWLWTTYAFVRGIESRGWSIAAGVLFGLALLTKFDAIFIPLPLATWGVVFHGRKSLRNLLAMAVIGPLVFFAGWPWLWIAPVKHIGGYVADKLGRTGGDAWIVPSCYFGKLYVDSYPPWHYPLVMTAITIPLGVLLAIVLGCVEAARKIKRPSQHALFLISAGVILLLFSMPNVPRYDGVRLFLSLFPLLAMLGGVGLAWVLSKLPQKGAILFAVAFIFSQAIPLATMAPCHLSYYSRLVGGTSGAVKLGMEPTYWGDSVTWEAFDWLYNQHPFGPRARVAFFPMSEFIAGGYDEAAREFKGGLFSYDYYVDDNRFRIVKFDDQWDYAVLFARQSMIGNDPAAKALWESAQPVWTFSRGGVDLCRIYRKR